MIKAIDISKWQSTFDPSKAKQQGIDTVFLRACYSTYKDTKYNEFAQLVADNGFNLGSYQFVTWHYNSVSNGNFELAKQKMLEQVNYYIGILKTTAKHNSYCALDFEIEQGQYTSLTKQQLTELCNLYMDTLSNAGFSPLFYASASFIRDRVNYADIKYPWWVAYYANYGTPTDFGTLSEDFASYGLWGKFMADNRSKVYVWQFSSEGFGARYGVGSDGLDKNYCYVSMNVQNKPIPKDPCKFKIGFASSGDIKTIDNKIKSLGIGTTIKDGYIYTDLMSSGDQLAIIAECNKLSVPYEVYADQPTSDIIELQRQISELQDKLQQKENELTQAKETLKLTEQTKNQYATILKSIHAQSDI